MYCELFVKDLPLLDCVLFRLSFAVYFLDLLGDEIVDFFALFGFLYGGNKFGILSEQEALHALIESFSWLPLVVADFEVNEHGYVFFSIAYDNTVANDWTNGFERFFEWVWMHFEIT